MYVEIVGRFVSGPSPTETPAVGAPPASTGERIAWPISWPRGEDGTVILRLLDELGQAVELDTNAGDTAKLCIGANFAIGAIVTFVAEATSEPGKLSITVPSNSTKSLAGPYVYDVRVKKGDKEQQVVPPAYFTVTPSIS